MGNCSSSSTSSDTSAFNDIEEKVLGDETCSKEYEMDLRLAEELRIQKERREYEAKMKKVERETRELEAIKLKLANDKAEMDRIEKEKELESARLMEVVKKAEAELAYKKQMHADRPDVSHFLLSKQAGSSAQPTIFSRFQERQFVLFNGSLRIYELVCPMYPI